MKIPGIVLSTSPYSFRNEQGEVTQGVTAIYMATQSLSPTEANDRGAKGYNVAKVNLSYDLLDKIDQVPGLYDLDIEMRMNRQMKGEIVVVDLDFSSALTA
ncbi:MAG: hypothetical protein LBR98_10295 [Syntrophomonadaceae bacterium]|jgi:hypothetical protein|nr:hypothetical protein [Syntrophomonadaceae bacterium]